MRTLFLLFVALFAFGDEVRLFTSRIALQPNGELLVQESIHYRFDTSRHGIYRDIPLTIKGAEGLIPVHIGLELLEVTRDGSPAVYQVRRWYDAKAGEILRIRIGDPKRTLSGDHLYTITYRVRKGILPASIPGYDALRWNILGSAWQVYVRKVRAEVLLPTRLDKSHVRIATWRGRYGSHQPMGGKIQWLSPRRLVIEDSDYPPGEGATIEVAFAKGLLPQSGEANLKPGLIDIAPHFWLIAGFVLYLLLLLFVAKRLGVTLGKLSAQPQYYPPKDLSLLQSGVLIDRFADDEDIVPALFELAQKGYLRIEDERIVPTGKKSEALTPDQKALLGFVAEGIDLRHKEMLASRYEALRRALRDMLYEWSVRAGYFRHDPQKTRRTFLLIAFLAAVPLLLLGFWFVRDLGTAFVFVALMALAGIAVLAQALAKRQWSVALFMLVWVGSVVAGEEAFRFPLLLLGTLLLLALLVIWYLYRRIGKYTAKGLQALRYLKGYEEFLGRVEKDRIKRFLAKDPHYLDINLPYAMLFGVSDAWKELYKSFAVAQPVWYAGDFDRFDTIRIAPAPRRSASGADFGGFAGGGGFSGGGMGGGGGGSW